MNKSDALKLTSPISHNFVPSLTPDFAKLNSLAPQYGGYDPQTKTLKPFGYNVIDERISLTVMCLEEVFEIIAVAAEEGLLDRVHWPTQLFKSEVMFVWFLATLDLYQGHYRLSDRQWQAMLSLIDDEGEVTEDITGNEHLAHALLDQIEANERDDHDVRVWSEKGDAGVYYDYQFWKYRRYGHRAR